MFKLLKSNGFSIVELLVAIGVFTLVIVFSFKSDSFLNKLSKDLDKKSDFISFKSSIYAVLKSSSLCEQNLKDFSKQVDGTLLGFNKDFVVNGEVFISSDKIIVNDRFKELKVDAMDLFYKDENTIELRLSIVSPDSEKKQKVRYPITVYYDDADKVRCETSQQRTTAARCRATRGEYDKETQICNLFQLGEGFRTKENCLKIGGNILESSEDNLNYCDRGTNYFKVKDIKHANTNKKIKLNENSIVFIANKDIASNSSSESIKEEKEFWNKEIRRKKYIKNDEQLEITTNLKTYTKENESDEYGEEKISVLDEKRDYKDEDIFLKDLEIIESEIKVSQVVYEIKTLIPLSEDEVKDLLLEKPELETEVEDDKITHKLVTSERIETTEEIVTSQKGYY